MGLPLNSTICRAYDIQGVVGVDLDESVAVEESRRRV
jgi:hypothetical protein